MAAHLRHVLVPIPTLPSRDFGNIFVLVVAAACSSEDLVVCKPCSVGANGTDSRPQLSRRGPVGRGRLASPIRRRSYHRRLAGREAPVHPTGIRPASILSSPVSRKHDKPLIWPDCHAPGALFIHDAVELDFSQTAVGLQNIRSDAVGDPSRRLVHRLSREVRIARRGLDLTVAEQLADHRQALAQRKSP